LSHRDIDGPLWVPVNVTMRQGAASAVDTMGVTVMVKMQAIAANDALIIFASCKAKSCWQLSDEHHGRE